MVSKITKYYKMINILEQLKTMLKKDKKVVVLEPSEPVEQKGLVNEPVEVVYTERAMVLKDGKFVREYNLDIHGENYEELAAKFADKIGGSVSK